MASFPLKDRAPVGGPSPAQGTTPERYLTLPLLCSVTDTGTPRPGPDNFFFLPAPQRTSLNGHNVKVSGPPGNLGIVLLWDVGHRYLGQG